jgi:hypothetical protein
MGPIGRALAIILLWTVTCATASALTVSDFRSCLSEEAGTKERLDCYDAILPPQPRAGFKTAKTINECRHAREQDARLICYDSYMVAVGPGQGGRSAVSSSTTRASSSPQMTPRASAPRSSDTGDTLATAAKMTQKAIRASRRASGPCPCGSGRVCVGPRGGRYCLTSAGNKRYGR